MVGISSGEEAYSLAIAFSELLESSKTTIPIKIFASDADSGSIDYASAVFTHRLFLTMLAKNG